MAHVNIKVDTDTGKFSYTDNSGNDAEKADAKRNEPLEWAAGQGIFMIHFIGTSPCGHKNHAGTPGSAASCKVQPNAGYQSYKYFVVVHASGRLFTDDPYIIVKP
jgi:hypothetical protein